ncbi:biotin--[acetyl-CoA-carboxylase] ligase [Flavobacterium sp.]|uniref:biotin--[acetyl-CoA-carboxylase] ligase n=1 Tax=Flavobacterium sp. TaxID=239 RepID=UPI0025E7340F|nr:biotin--[acetyl-CoA-carboxylase] ligase [Flavobacterium sp.]
MSLIKLNAIDSTNDYLKQLSKIEALENFTIVMANEQTQGKGQMGAKWISEPSKNLTMSILVTNFVLKKHTIFDLNVVTAVSILKVLQSLKIQQCKIKWPNDIMADSKKVGGILIENSLKPDGSINAIIGVGLNVNQTNFEHLPQANSLSCITGVTYSPESIALLLKKSLQDYLQILTKNQDAVWDEYHQNLFKIQFPSAFEDKTGKQFMGIIQKVTRDGKLEVQLEDDSVAYFEVKELKMLY